MRASCEKISWMLPLSHLEPSETNTSSASTWAPRLRKSCCAIASRRKS